MARNEERSGTERDAPGEEGERPDADRTDTGGQFVDESGYNEEHARRDPGNPLTEVSLYALLIVVGAVLFLIPEPSTSAVGAIMIAAGVIAWLIDAAG